jgi:mannose-6-phosphate isomerase-like protein (cupin superfamily)
MRRFADVTQIPAQVVERNHGGTGLIEFRRLLTSADFAAPVDFVDYTIIPPGSTIGLHRHDGNEEVYFIAAGAPRVAVEQEERRLERGSVAVVHAGQSHRLINDCGEDVVIFVIQVRLAPQSASVAG